MALRSRMLLEQRGYAVAGEDADAVIGNRSSHTELIGSQPRQLVLHARFLVERRQLYSEIGIERKNNPTFISVNMYITAIFFSNMEIR